MQRGRQSIALQRQRYGRNQGRVLLQAWLDRAQLNQRGAARLFGLHYTYVSQILCGRRQPSLANAVAIYRTTGIAVDAWLPTGEGKKAAVVSLEGRKRKLA